MNQLLLILICILVLIFGIYKNVKSQLTVNNYLITNYMYVFTALLIFAMTNMTLEKDPDSVFKVGSRLMPLFILTLVILFGLAFTPQPNQGMKHLLWLGFIILISVTGHPIYMKAKEDQIMTKVLLTLGVIFLSMSYIAYSNQLGFFDGYAPYLMMGLLGLIIFQTLDLVFADYSSTGIKNRFWYYSLIGLVLFSGFLVYDTQKKIKEGLILQKICKNHFKCADYPTKSLDLFLDVLNMFNQLTIVYGGK